MARAHAPAERSYVEEIFVSNIPTRVPDVEDILMELMEDILGTSAIFSFRIMHKYEGMGRPTTVGFLRLVYTWQHESAAEELNNAYIRINYHTIMFKINHARRTTIAINRHTGPPIDWLMVRERMRYYEELATTTARALPAPPVAPTNNVNEARARTQEATTTANQTVNVNSAAQVRINNFNLVAGETTQPPPTVVNVVNGIPAGAEEDDSEEEEEIWNYGCLPPAPAPPAHSIATTPTSEIDVYDEVFSRQPSQSPARAQVALRPRSYLARAQQLIMEFQLGQIAMLIQHWSPSTTVQAQVSTTEQTPHLVIRCTCTESGPQISIIWTTRY